MRTYVLPIACAGALLATSVAHAQAPGGAPGGGPVDAHGRPAQPAPAQPAAAGAAGANLAGVGTHAPIGMVPRTIEKGGGAGRVMAYVTLGLGITAGVGALGAFGAARYVESKNEEDAGLFGSVGAASGEDSTTRALDDAALFGGIGAGVTLASSLVLFLVTDAKTTEIVYEPAAIESVAVRPPAPPAGAEVAAPGAAPPAAPRAGAKPFTLSHELPYGAYAVTAVGAGLSIAATLFTIDASNDLEDPATHPSPSSADAAERRAEQFRGIAVTGWALTGVAAAWAAFDTYRAVARVNASQRVRAGIAPMKSGVAAMIEGSF